MFAFHSFILHVDYKIKDPFRQRVLKQEDKCFDFVSFYFVLVHFT